MSADFKIKAIETIYDNYRFRSRLEARWAVFFHTLGLPYEYEKEGYDLEGVRYLPDFWLPNQKCFIEIKGQEPSADELKKVRLLSLYTSKDVHLFYGEVGIPKMGGRTGSVFYTAPRLWKYRSDEGLGRSTTHQAPVAPDLLILRQKLDDCHMSLEVDENGNFIVIPWDDEWKTQDLSSYQQILEQQQKIIPVIQEIASTRQKELLDLLIPNEGWDQDFQELQKFRNARWMQCLECEDFRLLFSPTSHICLYGKENTFSDDTPWLKEAYTAARQARFEFGR
jgi:hypothetical protein